MLNNKHKLHLSKFFARFCCSVILLLCFTPLVVGFTVMRNINIKADGQLKTIRTNSENFEKIVSEAGISLGPNDRCILLGLNTSLQDGSTIEVVRTKNFKVIHNNEVKSYSSSKATIGEALKNVGIVHYKDKVYPSPEEILKNDMSIFVLGKKEELHLTEGELAFSVQYEEDHNLAFGIEKVRQEGKLGKEKIISKLVKNKDGSTSLEEVGRQVVEPPISKIVAKGSAKSVKTPEGYKKYSKLLHCEATAYTHTGYPTALGFMPYWGIVAVDPRVIPHYTKLYIPGYGLAMAGDTGGAIIHHRIDLFMNTERECINWGRRKVEVYILEE